VVLIWQDLGLISGGLSTFCVKRRTKQTTWREFRRKNRCDEERDLRAGFWCRALFSPETSGLIDETGLLARFEKV